MEVENGRSCDYFLNAAFRSLCHYNTARLLVILSELCYIMTEDNPLVRENKDLISPHYLLIKTFCVFSSSHRWINHLGR